MFATSYAQFQHLLTRRSSATTAGMSVTARARLGVLGWPVAHSRSPAIQNAALAAAGLDGWRYQLLPVPPELFSELVRALPGAGFAGANVTIPHKQAALELAAQATDRARAIGAANTLMFGPGGAIAADNTDAPALVAALPFAAAGADRPRARRRRQRPRRGVGAAGRRRVAGERCGTGRRSVPAGWPPSWAPRPPPESRPPTCSSTAPRSGSTAPTRSIGFRSRPATSPATAASSTSSTPPPARS